MFNDQNNPGYKRNTYQTYQYQLEEIAFHQTKVWVGDNLYSDKSHNFKRFLFHLNSASIDFQIQVFLLFCLSLLLRSLIRLLFDDAIS